MKRRLFRVKAQFQHRTNIDFECGIKKLFLELDQNVSFLYLKICHAIGE
jgi:hypothetical protein